MTSPQPAPPAGLLSRIKYWATTPLSAQRYWYMMGKLKPVAAVTSNFDSVADCLASGEQVVALLEGLVELSPDAVTLQIGSGLGRVEFHLAHRVRRCYGVDVSASMVRRARRLVSQSNVTFIHTDGSGTMWPDEKLDIVYSFFVFQHVPRAVFFSYLDRAGRGLVPGGHLVFQMMIDESKSLPDPPPLHPYGLRYYTRTDVEAALASAGFDLVQRTDMNGHPDEGSSNGDVVFCARRR